MYFARKKAEMSIVSLSLSLMKLVQKVTMILTHSKPISAKKVSLPTISTNTQICKYTQSVRKILPVLKVETFFWIFFKSVEFRERVSVSTKLVQYKCNIFRTPCMSKFNQVIYLLNMVIPPVLLAIVPVGKFYQKLILQSL